MKRALVLSATFFIVLAGGLATSQQAAPPINRMNFGNYEDTCLVDTLIINTGYNHNTGSVYAIGSLDNYWTLIGQPPGFGGGLPRPADVIDPHTGWHGPLANSRWLGPHPSAANSDSGVYVFEYEFCVDDTTGARLYMEMLVDDDAVVKLNTIEIGATPPNPFPCNGNCNFQLPPMTISITNDGHFKLENPNTLTIEANNRWAVAMGLNVKGYITAPGISMVVPECCDPTGGLGGFKWNDLDGSGTWQPTEPLLENWPIHLSNGMNTTTDEFGYYFFMDVPPGDYTVTETHQTDWVQTAPPYPGSYNVTLDINETINNLNFGNKWDTCLVQCKT